MTTDLEVREDQTPADVAILLADDGPDYPEITCWVCDALKPSEFSACGCDDIGYSDGSDGVWF